MFFLRLLGGVSLEGPSGPLTGRVVQRRRLALLALLAAEGGRGCSRDKLVGYLWPESDEASARRLLSDSLYVVRQALGEDCALTSGELVRLNPEVVRTDVVDFEKALEAEDLQRAVELYGGPFLESFHSGAAAEFDLLVPRRVHAGWRRCLPFCDERHILLTYTRGWAEDKGGTPLLGVFGLAVQDMPAYVLNWPGRSTGTREYSLFSKARTFLRRDRAPPCCSIAGNYEPPEEERDGD